jgi:asparagine synthase (glutamine-hydrolysing)
LSVQFGRWNFDGRSVDPEYIAKVRACLALHAPDSTTICVKGAFFLLYGAFHTTKESCRERQPSISPSGTHLTWAGRLDNRSELIGETDRHSSLTITDLDIVSSSYEKDGTESLSRLVGDWSLSALHHYERRLVLAVDFLGTRPLYYFRCHGYVAWSTVLAPLIALADDRFTLREEYLAGWFSGFPAASLTPFREIHAVPPGSFVEITRSGTKTRKYWDFDPHKFRHLSSDDEYEEGFRHFFSQAVGRRLRSGGPVLSELSGGVDSSSIVCVADRVLANEPSLAPRLDTLSYLDDTEPDWNERPFVSTIETARNRIGIHVDVSTQLTFLPERDLVQFPCTPADGLLTSLPQCTVSAYLRDEGIRVVLSGLGGDETTGGVPTGIPELADLLARAKLMTFFRRAVAWSLAGRRPLIHTVGNAVGEFLPQWVFGTDAFRAKIPWLNPTFARRCRAAGALPSQTLKLFGPLPSFQENLLVLDDLRSQIVCAPPSHSPVRERRYPFLDRDLLEFLYSIPRAQIVRPGRRRCLLRRALRGIVPEAVLERKRKAYVTRGPLKSFQAEFVQLKEWTKEMLCASIGLIDPVLFQTTLEEASRGNHIHLWRISRTLALESWLRDARVQSVLRISQTSEQTDRPGGLPGIARATTPKSPQLGRPKQEGGETHEIRDAGNPLRG